jgi:3-oxoacyl-[acyl-carrier-protein] synthase-3
MMPQLFSHITGWGSYVPERILTNADFERMVDTKDEWIVSRTGIRERHISAPGETSSVMATHAARKALTQAGIDASELDLILVGTCTADYRTPSTACLIQHALGARCGAFDLQAGCPGFLYALTVADQFVRAGSCRHVLVIGVEHLSPYVDYTDRSMCVLFGDGAGAAIISAREEPGGIRAWMLGSDGAQPEILWAPAGGGARPIGHEELDQRLQYVRMQGQEVFKFATLIAAPAIEEVLHKAGARLEEIDWFLLHQANLRIIEAIARRLKVPMEKMVVTVDRYGNTSAASIPMALCDAIAEGRIHAGQRLMLLSFGAGLTWSAILIDWTART